MNTIYKPKGAAAEYGDYAVNIYTGCPHRCYYCFAPQVLHRDREAFHSCVEPRKDIVPELRRKLEREKITGKLVHLCFTCDPYPTGCDTATTREVIQALKEFGNHVQILTKGDGSRDFDLLDGGDWYGVTISCDAPMADEAEPGAVKPADRLYSLEKVKCRGVNTWVSAWYSASSGQAPGGQGRRRAARRAGRTETARWKSCKRWARQVPPPCTRRCGRKCGTTWSCTLWPASRTGLTGYWRDTDNGVRP